MVSCMSYMHLKKSLAERKISFTSFRYFFLVYFDAGFVNVDASDHSNIT